MTDAPVILDSLTSNGTSTTSIGVDIPPTAILDTDLVVIVVATADVTHSTPPGWAPWKSYQDTGFCRVSFFSTVGTAVDENDTVSITAGSATPFAAVALHIRGARPDILTFSTGSDTAAALINGGNAATAYTTGRNNLWLAIAGWVDDDANLVGYSSLYNHLLETVVSGGGTNAGVGVAVAARRWEADSETYGTWQLDQSEAISEFVACIQPALPEPAPAPAGPAGLEVSMKVDGVWTDVGEAGVYTRDPVTIRQGRSDWASQAEPSSARFTLDNRAGLWSPDYQSGALFGKFRRGTPVRIGAPQPDAYLEYVAGIDNDTAGRTATVADMASLDDVVDLDVRWEIEAREDTSATLWQIAERVDSWSILMGRNDDTGTFVRLQWDDGFGPYDYESWETGEGFPAEADHRRMAFRVTLDVSTGVGRFYWSDSIGGSWTEVGDGLDDEGTSTDIGTGTSSEPVKILGPTSSTYRIAPVAMYAFKLMDGLDGTEIIDADFTGITPDTASFTDDAGAAWTVESQGRVSSTRWRFHGEMADLPARWSLSGNDQWAPAEANGYLRRLRKANTLRSTLRRGFERETLSSSVDHYWPMEETGGGDLRAFGPVIGESFINRRLNTYFGPASPAVSNVFSCSGPLPTFDEDRWDTGLLARSTPTAEFMIRFLFYSPPGGLDLAGDTGFLSINTLTMLWILDYAGGGGDIRVRGYRISDASYTEVVNDAWDFNIDGLPVRFSFTAEQDGSDVDYTISVEDQFSGTGGGGSGTASSCSVGQVHSISLGGTPADPLRGLVLGHLSVESLIRSSGNLVDELTAYRGERAATRVRRLCSEEGLEARVYGNPEETAILGPQLPGALGDLLQECADTDLGILYDPMETLAVGFRAGHTLRNQDAGFAIDYDAGDILGTPDLDRDSDRLANDVTVQNADGTEARVEDTTSLASVLEPPDGIGRRDQTYRVNEGNPEESLLGHAHTRLALNTVDEPRVSRLVLATHLAGLTDADLQAIAELRVGDKLGLADLPPLIHPDDLNQLIQGWTETIDTVPRTIAVNTTPARPWDTGVIQGTGEELVARYDTAGSTLGSGEPAGSTSLVVITDVGERWTTSVGDFPFDIDVAGARVTVTGISGTVSPQVFTVTATTIDLPGGSDVRLADPTYWSF